MENASAPVVILSESQHSLMFTTLDAQLSAHTPAETITDVASHFIHFW